MNVRSDLFLYAKCLDVLDLVEYCASLQLGFQPVMWIRVKY
jgi:hypothetical protein